MNYIPQPVKQNPNRFTLFAQPDESGFFGLSELQTFIQTLIEPFSLVKDVTFILDFSEVKIWDIAAVLWFVVALHHYRQHGFNFLLRLPEASKGMSGKDAADFERSADFLRRWELNVALLNLSPDPSDLLVDDQKEFFSKKDIIYREKEIYEEDHLVNALISQRLLGIRNLSDLNVLEESKKISYKLITECIKQFQSARIGDILWTQTGIEKRKADLFADHLLTEALMNVKEHPNATMGMISIGILGATKELILAVADNGEPIPKTIFSVYLEKESQASQKSYDETNFDERAFIAHYATKEKVSRKKIVPSQAENIGMGLTYIRNDTVNTFGGKLRIVTDGIYLNYAGDCMKLPEKRKWPHPWKGNLLRISIPIKRLRTLL